MFGNRKVASSIHLRTKSVEALKCAKFLKMSAISHYSAVTVSHYPCYKVWLQSVIGTDSSKQGKRFLRVNNGYNSPFSKDTQWETFDIRANVFDSKNNIQLISTDNLESSNEVAKRLSGQSLEEIYGTLRSDWTNFSVFQNVHEHSFHQKEIFANSSIKKNISELKFKQFSVQTKASHEPKIEETLEEGTQVISPPLTNFYRQRKCKWLRRFELRSWRPEVNFGEPELEPRAELQNCAA